MTASRASIPLHIDFSLITRLHLLFDRGCQKIIDQDTFNAFVLIFYQEGREKLVRELLENADLFMDGAYSVVEKPGSDLRLVPEKDRVFDS